MEMNSNPTVVLITGVGSSTALSVVKALRRSTREYRIVGVDTQPAAAIAGAVFCDEFAVVPLATEANYIETLIAICKQHNASAIVPIIDIEVETIAKYKEQFEQAGIATVCSSEQTVKNCNDKYATFTALRDAGIESTPVVTLQDGAISEVPFDFPIFIKPRRGVSSVGAHKVESPAELRFFADHVKDPIVQPFLKGQMYVVDVINTADHKNLVAIPRMELESKSGVGVKARTVQDEQVAAYAIQIAEALQIVGPANIELMKDGNSVQMIEINPRFSSGSIISTVAGVNIHELAILLALKESIAECSLDWKPELTMNRYWNEVFYLNDEAYGTAG